MSLGMYSVSKTEPQKYIYRDGMQNSPKKLTSKNELSNCSSFGKYETTNEFVEPRQVRGWFQMLISSPSWPCMQNETTLIHNSSSKSVIFKMLLTIGKNHFEGFFTAINNLELLPSNSPSIDWNHISKLRFAQKTRKFFSNFQRSI